MTIEVKSKFNPKKIAEELLEKQAKALERELQAAAREIQKRTLGGIDADGGSFKGYTPEYKKYKQRKGRSGKVDLTFTGEMLRAMSTSIERLGGAIIGKIKFNSAAEGAKAKGNMKKRKFFALSAEQVKKITDAIRKVK